ncbi:MAG: hemolysin family protein [Lachnospiraceae bacterium]|nr:hemolysin family protein [Lachnospiraceae bacterium]
MIGALILQVILIASNAVFASAEIAVISMNDMKLKKLAGEGDSRAQKLNRLKEQPSKFLSTIQVAITLAGFLGSAYAADHFAEPLVALLFRAEIPVSETILNSVSVLVITIILSYFSIVFGELVPKRIAMKNPDKIARRLSGILGFVSTVFAPLVGLLTVSTNGILKLLGIDPNQTEETVSEEEIRMLLAQGNEQGVIPPEENAIIQNVFEFSDQSVGQVCTRRREVVYLSMDNSMEEWKEIIHGNRHRYYPVCEGSMDDIAGILDTMDYFRLEDKSRESVMKAAAEPAFFVPETMHANVLFSKMKQERRYFAVVIDEYGGLSGIVTLHDLMETLVGDLDDIDEPVRPKDIERLDEITWQIQGFADLSEVSDALKLELPTGKYDTFSGFVCDVIKRVPEDGESFQCETDGMLISVLDVENHVVGACTVKILKKE